MAYQEMYKLPLINAPVPTSALNIPVGNEKGFMYKLPKIQDSSNEADANPLRELEDRQEVILQKLEALKDRVQSMKQSSTTGKAVSCSEIMISALSRLLESPKHLIFFKYFD